MDEVSPSVVFSRIGLVLGQNQRDVGDKSRVDDRREAFRAYRQGKHALLESMLNLAVVEPSITFFTLRLMDELFESRGAGNVEAFLVPDAALAFQRLNKVAPDLIRGQRLQDVTISDTAEADLMFFMITADPSDREIIERIITERGLVSVEEVQSVLLTMKDCTSALSSGSL
jgi:hypothetical protein